MGPEGSPSGVTGTAGLGSVGGVAVASAGPSISAEFGTSGIGFDGGSPTFSGLGRSDANLGSFSVSEGSKGPVSFTNSTDLFAETKAVTSPIFSVPEGPVMGDVFNQTEIIAQAPIQEPISSPEPVSILAETSPFQITMPVNEAPVPSFSFKDTVEIAGLKSEPINAEPILEISAQPEINVEDALESYLKISPENLTQTLEDFKTQNPAAAYELDQNLKLAEKVIEIAHEVTDSETAAKISNIAIDRAVERSGLVLETEPEASGVQTDQTVDSSEETKDPLPVPENSANNSFVRDEDANKARIDNRHQAAEEVLKEADGEIVEGEDIIAKISKTESEQSGLAKIIGVDDGSISPGDEVIKKAKVTTIQEADSLIYHAVNDNSGVTEGISGIRATDGEKAKVAGKNLSSPLLV